MSIPRGVVVLMSSSGTNCILNEYGDEGQFGPYTNQRKCHVAIMFGESAQNY